MGIHVLPRVHQALLILFILQSSVVCENTDDWVEKGPPGEGRLRHRKGYTQVGPPERPAGPVGLPPQSQDPATTARVQALLEEIKKKNPQALGLAMSYLPKSFHLPETVTNLWNKYGWGRKQAPKPPQAPPQPPAPSGSRLSWQNADRIKGGIPIDSLPVEPESRDVPLEWQDENEAGIDIQGQSNQPALHQDLDKSQPIAEARPQAQYLPDLIPTEQYAPPAEKEPNADQGPRPAEEYEHDEINNVTPVDNQPGQDDNHPGVLEPPYVQPQPQNTLISNAYESDPNNQNSDQDQTDYAKPPPPNPAYETPEAPVGHRKLWAPPVGGLNLQSPNDNVFPTTPHAVPPPPESAYGSAVGYSGGYGSPPPQYGYGSGGGYSGGYGSPPTQYGYGSGGDYSDVNGSYGPPPQDAYGSGGDYSDVNGSYNYDYGEDYDDQWRRYLGSPEYIKKLEALLDGHDDSTSK